MQTNDTMIDGKTQQGSGCIAELFRLRDHALSRACFHRAQALVDDPDGQHAALAAKHQTIWLSLEATILKKLTGAGSDREPD